ncbi:MAG: baseplate J/gp47 family protein [Selenomonadaceae bacterium]|nr:baseplate J/gp47 family protein [Selenomonadaceae bacterium]
MAYVAPYVDDAGLHIPSYVDIRDDLVEQYKIIFGDDVYLDPDSQDYQMISAYASKTYDTMQLLQIVYNNHSPKTAVGSGLSSVVKLNGITRKAASYSTCVLTLTGRQGTEIAAGVCKDEQGNLWKLPENITLTGETMDITAECDTIGAIEAMPGTINIINTPQAGWIAVTNKVPAVVGQPVETDLELRVRQSLSVALPSRNMLDGTRAAIAAIEGVTRFYVYDNDTGITDGNGIPSHSICAVVEGGLDADIAEAIYLHKGPGGGTYGNTAYDYMNPDGITTRISYSRPSYTAVDVAVTVKRGTGYTTDLLDIIKTNIETYINSLSVGDDVPITGILTAITAAVVLPTNPAFRLASLTIAKAGESPGLTDIEIVYDALAEVGNITVTEVG